MNRAAPISFEAWWADESKHRTCDDHEKAWARLGWNSCLLSAPAEPKAQAQAGGAKQHFNECGPHDDLSPLEQLRLFCSLAMNGTDWLDVEPLFAALPSPPPREQAAPEYRVTVLTDRGEMSLEEWQGKPASSVEARARALFEEMGLIADDEKCIAILCAALAASGTAPEQVGEPVAELLAAYKRGAVVVDDSIGSIEMDDQSWSVGQVREALYAASKEPAAAGHEKLWLWKNGDHFLAFRHLYPCFTPGGDPMTLGEPVGWASLRPSFDRITR